MKRPHASITCNAVSMSVALLLCSVSASNASVTIPETNISSDTYKLSTSKYSNSDTRVTKQVLVIDSAVADQQSLLKGVDPNIEVIHLVAGRDGLVQLAEALHDRSGLEAIHLVSHGGPGSLVLGGVVIDEIALATHSRELAIIGKALGEKGDMLLYGCHVAEGEKGKAFIRQFSRRTGADVAASDDSTGASSLGGDWVLESSYGTIDSEIIVASAQRDEYQHLLATFDFEGATGSGTSTVTTTVSGVTLTITDPYSEFWLGDGTSYAGTSGTVLVGGLQTTNLTTFSFSSPVDLTSFRFANQGTVINYTFTPTGGVGNNPVNATSSSAGADINVNWSGITGFTVTENGGDGIFSDTLFDTLVFTVSNTAPLIGGTVADQPVDDIASTNPFSGVTISDADGDNVTTTVTLDDNAKGLFTTASLAASGFTGPGPYSLALTTPANAQAAIRQLVFDPTDNRVAPGSTETTTFTITVNDGTADGTNNSTTVVSTSINDNPEITSDGGGASAAVNATENQTAVTTVTSADVDPGESATYSISGGADDTLFDIDASLGTLTFKVAPDFESPSDTGLDGIYNVQVKVTDGFAGTDVQDIVVTVTNTNDYPVITSNGGGDIAGVNAAENQTAVTNVEAADQDNDTLTYSITGGADQALFDINSSTGELTFVSAPNYESATDSGGNNVYDVQVTVKDDGLGTLSDVQDITVTVTNVNEAPVITSDGGAATASTSVSENSTAVTTVTATDVDSGDTKAYSISGGNDADLFSIDINSGVLTFKSAPDYENAADIGGNNVYDVQVRVTDSGSLTDEQDIAVTVTNINEDPAISGLPSGITVFEDTLSNVDLSAATFSDPDSWSADITLTLTVGAGTLTAASGSGVTVSGSGTGALTLTGTVSNIDAFLNTASNIQYTGEANIFGNNVTTLTLVANDGGNTGPGGGSDVALGTVNVDITAVNDAPTLTANTTTAPFTEGGTAVSLYSSAAASTVETGQSIIGLTLVVTNVTDGSTAGADEVLVIDSTDVALANGTNGTTAANGVAYSVALTGSTATVSLSGSLTVADLVNGLQYKNLSDNPTTASARVVTLTAIQDDGGTANGGVDTQGLAIASTVSLVGVNDAPVITGQATLTTPADTAITITLGDLTVTDPDNSYPTGFTLSLQGGGGHYSLSPVNIVIPEQGYVGDLTVPVIVNDGTDDSIAFNLLVTVTQGNTAPSIVGTPDTSVAGHTPYSFIPTANDADGDPLTFIIENKPSWANFNTSTGELSGTPTNSDIGTTTGIIIKVSDGTIIASLDPSFDITVTENPDIDGDGMPNDWETANGFDPLDPSDAALDKDGDGLTNLEEYQTSKNPDSDDNPPVVTPPADVTVDAVGLFTPVDVGTASAVDALDGSVSATSDAPSHFSPGTHTVTWYATDAAGNSATATQTVNVNPLISFGKSQTAAEGSTVSFSLFLNGPAASYPVTVPYTVGGSASTDGSDHSLSDGTITLLSGTDAVVSFNTVDDGAGEGTEQIVITMGTPTNAVAGVTTVHIIDVVEGNVAPMVTLSAEQGTVPTAMVVVGDGPVTVNSAVTDSNPADVHSYDWSGSDNALYDVDAADDTFTFDPATLSPGVYKLRLSVSDGNATGYAVLRLNVVATAPSLNSANDSDGDGIDDVTEGYGDSDGDGLADYLDAMDSSNVLQEMRGVSDSYLIEVEPGLLLRLGSTAFGTDIGQASITMDDVTAYGTVIADSEYAYNNGLFDFSVDQLPVAGQTVQVVLPQQAAIPAGASYRMVVNGMWQEFVVDTENSVASAPGEAGFCPPPGDSAYTAGLTEGNWCVQLTIEDGGPNDGDGQANNSVMDPGGISTALAQPVTVKVDSGGGAGSPWLLTLLGLLLWRVKLLRREVK